MPELVLMRHAKSDWDAPYDRDIRRPLSARGRRDAAAMGAALTAMGAAPDFVLTSPAVRAHATAEMAAAGGGWNAEVLVVDSLYGGGPGAVLDALGELPDPCRRALVLGHEPTWSETVGLLIGGGEVRMPTAAGAGLEVLVRSWRAIAPGTCRLHWLLPPRVLDRVRPAP